MRLEEDRTNWFLCFPEGVGIILGVDGIGTGGQIECYILCKLSSKICLKEEKLPSIHTPCCSYIATIPPVNTHVKSTTP